MTTAGRLVFQFMGDKSQLDATVKGARSGIGGLVNYAKGVLPGLIAAFGAVKSIDAADVQIQAEKKLAATLRATGNAAGLSADEIKKYASARQDITNFGDEQTIDAAGILATFKKIRGDVFKETLGLGQDMSAVMGTDLKGSIVQLGKALNDPIRGMSALAEVGVSFTQQQRDQIKAMQESGDLLGAQRVILSELKSEFGGAAEEMASPWQQLKNSMGDIAESFGRLLLPAVEAVAEGVKKLAKALEWVVDEFETLMGLSELHGKKFKPPPPLVPPQPEPQEPIRNEALDNELKKLQREIDVAQGADPLKHIVEDWKELGAPPKQIWEFIRQYRSLEKVKLNASVEDAVKDSIKNLRQLSGEMSDIDATLAEFRGADPEKLADLRLVLEEEKRLEEQKRLAEIDPLEAPVEALMTGTREGQEAIARAISRDTIRSGTNWQKVTAERAQELIRAFERMERAFNENPQVLVAPEGT